jgi:hypothetical protein
MKPLIVALGLALIAALLSVTAEVTAGSLPYAPAVTIVVDKNGHGDFTTINEALARVRTAGDASASKPYQVLVIPSDSEYGETIDVGGLRWTTIRGMGGTAGVRGLTGCASAAAACDHLTIEDLRFSGTLQFGVQNFPSTAYYTALRLHRIHVNEGSLALAASMDPAIVADFELSDSWLTGTTALGFTESSLYVGNRPALSGSSPNGYVRGSVHGNHFERPCASWGLVQVAAIGGYEDSSVRFSGNTFYCTRFVASSSGGGDFFNVRQGTGALVISDNVLEATIADDACGSTACVHRVFHLDGTWGSGSENEGRVTLLNNVARVRVTAAGNAQDGVHFVSIGPTSSQIPRETWSLSGNVFEVKNAGLGDLPDTNVKDVVIANGAFTTLVVQHRDQEFRYGTSITGGGKLLPWATGPLRTTHGQFTGDLTIPTSTPVNASPPDGQLWVNNATGQICYRAGGQDRCVTGTVPQYAKVARIGLTSAAGDIACLAANKGNKKAQADVYVVDRQTLTGVNSASVSGEWTINGTKQGGVALTDPSGKAIFVSQAYPPGTQFLFTVVNIVPPAPYLYDPALNNETADSKVCN